MEEDHLLIVSSSGNSTAVENLELSQPVHPNASPNMYARTTITISLPDVNEIKRCPFLSPYQLLLRIVCDAETTLICKEDVTPLLRYPVFVFLTPSSMGN
ncbi:hypothetical protein AVEN_155044-1 [Araneus ventricosus]|uniref:Uncharacterized protein n=1 Tax=Araneus ventricosus TaxID=182803 RepID=A0A4Y2A7I8_ARAVE|nr:hypothetical protein AVEN_155044-1 [Araneus ventricosus]